MWRFDFKARLEQLTSCNRTRLGESAYIQVAEVAVCIRRRVVRRPELHRGCARPCYNICRGCSAAQSYLEICVCGQPRRKHVPTARGCRHFDHWSTQSTIVFLDNVFALEAVNLKAQCEDLWEPAFVSEILMATWPLALEPCVLYTSAP